jgi:hypothetical protein
MSVRMQTSIGWSLLALAVGLQILPGCRNPGQSSLPPSAISPAAQSLPPSLVTSWTSLFAAAREKRSLPVSFVKME